MSDYWSGKRAVVTGASSGLGLHIARQLHAAGARVLLAARGAEPLRSAAAELGDRAQDQVCDVTCDEDVAGLTDRAVQWLEGIDIWVNAAGKSGRGAAGDTPLESFRELWELNFLATVRCSQAALPHLQASAGHLVNIGSLASKLAPRWLGGYAASKFPLAAFCQQLRLEQREHGVHVLLVCPGPLRRDDAEAARYFEEAEGLPAEAQQPGGGARVKAIDPNQLAEQILRACQRRRPELVKPGLARWLAAVCQISPSWGDWLLRRRTSG